MQVERMCICCRQMKDKKELLRIVKSKDGIIAIDKTGKANGRGAYVCANGDCLKNLKKSKSINKAFKCNVPQEVYEKIEEAILGQK